MSSLLEPFEQCPQTRGHQEHTGDQRHMGRLGCASVHWSFPPHQTKQKSKTQKQASQKRFFQDPPGILISDIQSHEEWRVFLEPDFRVGTPRRSAGVFCSAGIRTSRRLFVFIHSLFIEHLLYGCILLDTEDMEMDLPF